ncbi:MAG: tetratricopeptide repeat protein [Terriglobia bacterium]
MSEERSRLEQFKELAEIDPDDPVVHYGLGSEHLKRGEFDQAAAAFRKSIELQPDYSAAYRELGKALEKLGRRDEATEIYRQGKQAAARKGDLQTAKELEVFLKRLEKAKGQGVG